MSILTDPTLLAQSPAAYSSLGAPYPLSINGTGTGTSMSASLQQALTNLANATSQGDQRQYDLALGQLLGVFNGQNTLGEQTLMGLGANGQPTLAALDAEGLGVNGQPNLAAKTEAERQREADINTQAGLLDTASKLTGPKDYGDFMAMTGGGRSLMQQLLAGRPSSGAPVGDMEPMDLYSLMQKFGMGPGQTATSNPVSGPNFLTTGSPTKVGGGGGTDPNQPDNTDPMPADSSLFPTMANDADLAYAKATAAGNGAYDPSAYQAYISANGGTADWQPTTTTPGSAAVYGPADPTLSTLWGTFDPRTNYDSHNPENNAAIQRLVLNQFIANGGQGPGSGQTLYNGENTNAIDDKTVSNLVSDYMANRKGSLITPATDSATTGGEPSWFKDYMGALIGLGPNVNRGAAENLPLLSQLGLANPTGMSQLLNPAGNIDPAKWDALGPLGQSLLTQAASKVFGWDPTAFQQQIDAARPLGAPISGVQRGYTPLQLAA